MQIIGFIYCIINTSKLYIYNVFLMLIMIYWYIRIFIIMCGTPFTVADLFHNAVDNEQDRSTVFIAGTHCRYIQTLDLFFYMLISMSSYLSFVLSSSPFVLPPFRPYSFLREYSRREYCVRQPAPLLR